MKAPIIINGQGNTRIKQSNNMTRDMYHNMRGKLMMTNERERGNKKRLSKEEGKQKMIVSR